MAVCERDHLPGLVSGLVFGALKNPSNYPRSITLAWVLEEVLMAFPGLPDEPVPPGCSWIDDVRQWIIDLHRDGHVSVGGDLFLPTTFSISLP